MSAWSSFLTDLLGPAGPCGGKELLEEVASLGDDGLPGSFFPPRPAGAFDGEVSGDEYLAYELSHADLERGKSLVWYDVGLVYDPVKGWVATKPHFLGRALKYRAYCDARLIVECHLGGEVHGDHRQGLISHPLGQQFIDRAHRLHRFVLGLFTGRRS